MSQKDLLFLISECKKGKPSAQTTLMNLLWDRVYFFIFTKIKNKPDTEDITIKTFTKVFEKLKLYNKDFNFVTWVFAIAHNTMIDHTRKRPELNLSLDDELYDVSIATPSPEESLIYEQNNDELLKNIEKLPETYKKIIILRYMEDQTYKEIAAELGLSLSNVKVRLLRAKKLLGEELSKEHRNT